jgi:hypothetical protein
VLGIPVEEADSLAPRDDPAIWATRVTAQAWDLMLVGHPAPWRGWADCCWQATLTARTSASGRDGLVSLEDGPALWSVWLILPPVAA